MCMGVANILLTATSRCPVPISGIMSHAQEFLSVGCIDWVSPLLVERHARYLGTCVGASRIVILQVLLPLFVARRRLDSAGSELSTMGLDAVASELSRRGAETLI